MGQVGGDRPVNDAQHLAHGVGMGSKQVAQGEGEADDPLAQWHIGEAFIRQQGGGLGHAAGATAGTGRPRQSALLAGKRYEPLEVTRIATHAKKPVF